MASGEPSSSAGSDSLNFVLHRPGERPAWDAYLANVYGAGSVRYPFDVGLLDWFYWSAPLTAPISLYIAQPAGNVAREPAWALMRYGDGLVSHYAPLGFFVKRRDARSAMERGSLWLEVLREGRGPRMENPRWGYW